MKTNYKIESTPLDSEKEFNQILKELRKKGYIPENYYLARITKVFQGSSLIHELISNKLLEINDQNQEKLKEILEKNIYETTYITFKEKYNFKNLPDNYFLTEKTLMYSLSPVKDTNNITFKTLLELDEELKNSIINLKTWVNKLPVNNITKKVLKFPKYLKRTDFMNSVDSDKIWSKELTIPEALNIIEILKTELKTHKFKIDSNFIVNQRRKALKSAITEEILAKENRNNIEKQVSEALSTLWEFVNDEYAGNAIEYCREFGISTEEFYKMDKKYRKKGIICLQEKNIILEILSCIEFYINKN